jgi:hypothetical protein
LIASVGLAVALDDEEVETTLDEDFDEDTELETLEDCEVLEATVDEDTELETLEDFEVLEVTIEVLLTEVFELGTLVVDETTLLLLLDDAREVKRYISSLFPAPQYSYALPGQVNEQSESVARVDDAARVFPQ